MTIHNYKIENRGKKFRLIGIISITRRRKGGYHFLSDRNVYTLLPSIAKNLNSMQSSENIFFVLGKKKFRYLCTK